MNIQTPWVFYTSAMPMHHHHPGANKAAVAANAAAAGLIPINCPPGTSLLPHSATGLHAGSPFGAFNPAPAHHPSQLLLAAAAAAYGQQCAAASHLLHQPQHQHQHPIPNGSYHLKVHKVDDPSIIVGSTAKRKSSADDPESVIAREIKKAKLETKALKAKRPGFTDERYNETSYYVENGLRKVYPYYFTFTTFTKGRWVGEKILDVFAREFRAHPVEEYERCIKSGTLTVNYTKVTIDYRLKHNDLLANIVHRHEVPVTSDPIEVIHMDEDLVVVNKPASIPVHPCGRYRHNTVVFILAKEHQLKNLRTIHRLDRLTSGLLLFGRSPKKAREMEHQIRNRLVSKEYVCRVEGNFPDEEIECLEPIEVVSYKIGVCKVSKDGKDCRTTFKKLSSNGKTSVVLAKPHTGRMHQIRVHLQWLGYPIVNDPLYNHPVFGPEKGKLGNIGKSDEQLIQDLISIHNAENWLGIEGEDSGGGGGDIFGMALPGPTTDNQMASSPSSSLGTLEGGTIDTKSDNSPCSTGESLMDVKNGLAENALNKIESCITTGDIQPEAPNATDSPLALDGDKLLETRIDTSTESSFLLSGAAPSKVTVGTQTCDEDSSPSTPAASNVMTSSSQTVMLQQSSSSPSPQLVSNNNDNNNSSDDQVKFHRGMVTYDPHCYECKVRYRDPKPKDLVMYLHAIRYGGPEWQFETKLPAWASEDWIEQDET